MAASITAVFSARDGISNRLGEISQNGEKASKSFGVLKTAGVAAFAAIGTAAIATASKAVTEFADFQGKMNEVFTLLPNISDKGMEKMNQQVKQFSKNMGVLPEKVVPALYQSISAGVSEDNVFNFLETAQKAATGGVAELETAVDGLTSVINSYGEKAITAQKASDLMFTTVRLGKTDFKQLSGSIFNVLPSASAAGVKFEDVSAALAAVTAQGVPTSVATTKMRAAIDELAKSGTKTSDLFKQLAGKSFKDFIKGGGNLQQAMQMLEKHANKSKLGINDLFSSVEAGSAALALTGKGTAKFTEAMKEMRNCAGATDAAYAKMDRGLNRTLERLKANFSVALLDIGEAIAPTIEKAGNAIINIIPYFLKITQFIGHWISIVGEVLSPVIDVVSATIQSVINLFNGQYFVEAFKPVYDVFSGLADKLLPPGEANKFKENLNSMFIDAQWSLLEFTNTTLPQFNEQFAKCFSSIDLSGFINAMLNTFSGFSDIIMNHVIPTITQLADILNNYFVAGWEMLSTIASQYILPFVTTCVTAFNDNILPVIKSVVDFIKDRIVPIISEVFGFIADVVFPHIQEVASVVFPVLGNIFTDVCEIISAAWNDILKPVLDLIVAGFQFAWPFISGLVEASITEMCTIFEGLVEMLGGIIDFVTGVFTGNWSKAWEGVKTIFGGVFNSLSGLVKAPLNTVIALINGALQNINKISFDVPDWVPGFGGKHFGVNLPTIPMLAKGTENWKGGEAMVGEAGAEIVLGPQIGKLLAGSKVIPHDETLQALKQFNTSFTQPTADISPNLLENTPTTLTPNNNLKDNSNNNDKLKNVIDKIELNINLNGKELPDWINDAKAFGQKVVEVIKAELQESKFEGGDESIDY